MTTAIATGKLPFRTKLAFGIGSIGDVVFLGMLNTFISIYYNQAIGLSNALIGTAIMIAMLGDAISDPAIGLISDRWRSKLGRRHPFLFAAPIPLAIALYMMFQPPEALTGLESGGDVNQTLLFAWLCAWMVISRLSLTLYVIPHLALGGEITRDANDRSSLFSINAICGYVAGALFAFIAWGTFLGGESLNADGVAIPKHLDPHAYGPLVWTACAIAASTIFLSAWGTVNRVPYLSAAPTKQQRADLRRYYLDMLGALKNRNYAFLIFGFFFFMISVGLNETFGVFLNTYFWELETKQIRWFGLASAPAIFAGALSAPWLMKRFDRKPVLIAALIGIAFFAQAAVDLRLLGLMPENGSPALLPILLVGAAGIAFSLAIVSVAILSMLADVADQIELTTGLRQEGLIYSARAFFAKAANSAGHFVAGIVLDLFVRLPFDSVPSMVDDDVVLRLGLVGGPLMALGAMIAIPLYARYDLTKARHGEILDQLKQRQATPAE